MAMIRKSKRPPSFDSSPSNSPYKYTFKIRKKQATAEIELGENLRERSPRYCITFMTGYNMTFVHIVSETLFMLPGDFDLNHWKRHPHLCCIRYILRPGRYLHHGRLGVLDDNAISQAAGFMECSRPPISQFPRHLLHQCMHACLLCKSLPTFTLQL